MQKGTPKTRALVLGRIEIPERFQLAPSRKRPSFHDYLVFTFTILCMRLPAP